MMRIAIAAPRGFIEKNETNVVRDERLRMEPNGPTHEQLEAYWIRFRSAHVPDLAGDEHNHIKALLSAAVE